MMKIHLKLFSAAAVAALVLLSAQCATAGTILKLSLGDTGPDIEFSGGAGGVISTVNEIPATTGEQNTAIDFVGDLAPYFADILTPTASYTLNGVTAAGLATVVNGTSVSQLFVGGEFQLYDAANVLLLDVEVASSTFSGAVGSDTGAEFSITNGLVVGGMLAPYLDAISVSFAIAMTDIGPGGLAVTPVGPPVIAFPSVTIQQATINPFTADAAKLVAANVIIPEPATGLLLVFGGLWVAGIIRCRIE